MPWEVGGRAGLELLEVLQRDPDTSEVPLLMSSDALTRAMVWSALRAGARSFLMRPYEEEELRGVGPVSTELRHWVANSVYLSAPWGVLIWIVAFVALLVLGYFLHAAAMVGVTGAVVLIVRWLTREPPHRRRRRRQPNSSS